MLIEDLIVDLSRDPFHPALNFKVAVEYEKINQSASAVSFYLRTVEYGYDTHPDLAYNSLLKLAKCFDDQKDRAYTVSNALLQAIAFRPDRPEAYFHLAQFQERAGNWQECYTFAELGLRTTESNPLPAFTGYYGRFCLEFEKAVSAYWVGRKDESIRIFTKLHSLDLPSDYRASVIDNLGRLNVSL